MKAKIKLYSDCCHAPIIGCPRCSQALCSDCSSPASAVHYHNKKDENMINQEMSFVNHDDEDGNPAGGWVEAAGLTVRWQDGPLGPPPPFGARDIREPNGAFVETVIRAALQRIEYYQDTKFHCLENAVALGHLKAALSALEERTRGRTDRGVEGTHNE